MDNHLDHLFLMVRDAIAERLMITMDSISDEQLVMLIEDQLFHSQAAYKLSIAETISFVQRVFHSFRGYDALQPLLDDPHITEIMINCHDEIFIEREGAITPYEGKFESQQKLEDIIQAIVAKANRIVNESTPVVDARLQDGSRVNVVLPPIALKGPTMTIRKFPDQAFKMEDLIEKDAISSEAAILLDQLVKAQYNIFISGGTGSGKTTFLNALSRSIPSEERLITIEDSAELQMGHLPNLVRLETRNANTEGKGEITIRDLIRSSLRMRPNRIIVGEVRGAEVIDMLAAMLTGHDGSLSTGHANSATDMLTRLETMVLSGAPLPIGVIRKQIAAAIDIVIHLARMRDKSRKVMEISEVLGIEDEQVKLRPLYLFQEEKHTFAETVRGFMVRTKWPLQHTWKLERAGIKLMEQGG